MAVLGIAKIDSISYDSAGNFGANVSFVGCTSTSASGTQFIGSIPANITGALLNSAISTAVKNTLISGFGYSFGLLDYVQVIGIIL